MISQSAAVSATTRWAGPSRVISRPIMSVTVRAASSPLAMRGIARHRHSASNRERKRRVIQESLRYVRSDGRRTALPRQSMPTKKAVPPQSKAQLKDRSCGACAVSRPPSPGGLLVLGRGQVSRLGILRRGAFPFRVEQWPCPLVRFTVTGIVRKSHPVPLTRAHMAARRTRGAAASAYSSVRGIIAQRPGMSMHPQPPEWEITRFRWRCPPGG